MKKKYINSEVEIIYLNTTDVVATSDDKIEVAPHFDENNEDGGSYLSMFG